MITFVRRDGSALFAADDTTVTMFHTDKEELPLSVARERMGVFFPREHHFFFLKSPISSFCVVPAGYEVLNGGSVSSVVGIE